MRPTAALLDQLAAMKLTPMRAQPSVGVGERRSRSKGAGMEFIDHRPYQAGDDTRYLDPHVTARSGSAVIRQYAQERQLPVTILIDGSASMQIDGGVKFRTAIELAQLFGFVGLAGGDRVVAAAQDRTGLRWSPRWQGPARADAMFHWIATQEHTPHGGDFAAALRAVLEHLPRSGLLIVLSDWWGDGIERPLDMLAAAGQEVLAIQILSPAEDQPSRLGAGPLTLLDSEGEEIVEVVLDPEMAAGYDRLLADWRREVRESFAARQWHFLSLTSDVDLPQFFLRTLRIAGIIS